MNNVHNVTDISDIPIYIVSNDDVQLMSLIVLNLSNKGARNINVLINNQQEKVRYFLLFLYDHVTRSTN